MLGEYEIATVFQAIGVLGCVVYVGVYALLSVRVIGGDSLLFFGGNTVAATLVLLSNFGQFNLASVLIQIFFIFIGLSAMLLHFKVHGDPSDTFDPDHARRYSR